MKVGFGYKQSNKSAFIKQYNITTLKETKLKFLDNNNYNVKSFNNEGFGTKKSISSLVKNYNI